MTNASGTGPSKHRLFLLPPTGTRRTGERIELLLAEKQAALSLMRTAVTVLALPFAILAVVHYLSVDRVLVAAVPLIVLSLGLVAFGVILLAQGFGQCRRLDHELDTLKDKIGSFVDAVHTNG